MNNNFPNIFRLYMLIIFHIIFSTIILNIIFWAIFIIRLSILYITN